jgi:hypothetical protein
MDAVSAIGRHLANVGYEALKGRILNESSCLSDRPLVCSNIMAVAGDQTLKFKLVTFYMGDKDGESHMVGVSVSPNGTIGTKDFYDKQGENGASTGHSTYYFPDGSLMANYSNVSTGTNSGGHIVGKYQIVSGTGAYQGATGGGSIDGD